MEENQIQNTTILDLDDYSLLKLCEFLDYRDLYNLHVSHSRFHDVIEHFVCTKPIFTHRFWMNVDKAMEEIETIENFVQTFPYKGIDLFISIELFKSKIPLKIIFENDNNNDQDSVQIIELTNDFTERYLNKLRDLKVLGFNYLLSSYIRRCEVNLIFGTIQQIRELRNFHQLIRIRIDENYLETVEIPLKTKIYVAITAGQCDQVITNNPYKSLRLQAVFFVSQMLEYTTNLVTLDIENMKLDTHLLSILRNCRNLKKLSIRKFKKTTETTSFFAEISKWNKLKSLWLHTWEKDSHDEIIGHICKMKNLETLRLYLPFSYESLLPQIARCLKNLKHFEIIITCNYIDKDKEKELIKDFVQIATKLSCLSLDGIRTDSEVFHELARIQRAKRRKLQVIAYGTVGSDHPNYVDYGGCIQGVFTPAVDRT